VIFFLAMNFEKDYDSHFRSARENYFHDQFCFMAGVFDFTKQLLIDFMCCE